MAKQAEILCHTFFTSPDLCLEFKAVMVLPTITQIYGNDVGNAL